MLDRRTLRTLSYAAVGLVGGVAILYLPRLMFAGPPSALDPSSSVARTIGVAVAIGWALFFSLAGFRASDEYNRERSKFAWYWGSLVGIVACLPVVAFVGLGGVHGLDPATPAGHELFRAFRAGVVLPILAQVIGFFILTVWWRVTRR